MNIGERLEIEFIQIKIYKHKVTLLPVKDEISKDISQLDIVMLIHSDISYYFDFTKILIIGRGAKMKSRFNY